MSAQRHEALARETDEQKERGTPISLCVLNGINDNGDDGIYCIEHGVLLSKCGNIIKRYHIRKKKI